MQSELDELRRALPAWEWSAHEDLPGAILGFHDGLRLCLDRTAPGPLPAVWFATAREVAMPHHTLASVYGGLGETMMSVALRITSIVGGGDQ
jgi:hypothetical protein